jgi:hypothetical protein
MTHPSTVVNNDQTTVERIAAAIYDHVWFGGGNPDALPWLPNTTGRLTQYAPTARAILDALTAEGNKP